MEGLQKLLRQQRRLATSSLFSWSKFVGGNIFSHTHTRIQVTIINDNIPLNDVTYQTLTRNMTCGQEMLNQPLHTGSWCSDRGCVVEGKYLKVQTQVNLHKMQTKALHLSSLPSFLFICRRKCKIKVAEIESQILRVSPFFSVPLSSL